MRFWLLAVALVGSAGCTMVSLERHTVSQVDSAVDLRYQEVLDNLALIAHAPSALPSYASIFSGTIFVQDQGQLVSTNIVPFTGAVAPGSIGGNGSLNRQISQNWTLDPISAPEKIEAIRGCCQWVLRGPNSVPPASRSLLQNPHDELPGPDRHFGVANRLENLPNCWVCYGKLKDVPACARYKAHRGDTWVWVMPQGMKGLSDFTLIIQDIARVGINSQTLFNLPPAYTPIAFETADTARGSDKVKYTVQVVVDPSGRLKTNSPYYPARLDNMGTDTSSLRSAIGAAGIAH